MKLSKFLFIKAVFVLTAGFFCMKLYAQDGVPPEVLSIVNMKIDDGQEKLKTLGYDISSSSLTGKKQDWFNEKTKNCITVRFNKDKEITEVALNPSTSECQKGLDASRKVWEKYHDGQAPMSSDKIDAERKKLSDQGFKVSYWVNEAAPGRNSEYWINENTQKTMFIVWEVQGNKWVMTDKTDYKMGKNPAPSKK
jgi:hypothetical protein